MFDLVLRAASTIQSCIRATIRINILCNQVYSQIAAAACMHQRCLTCADTSVQRVPSSGPQGERDCYQGELQPLPLSCWQQKAGAPRTHLVCSATGGTDTTMSTCHKVDRHGPSFCGWRACGLLVADVCVTYVHAILASDMPCMFLSTACMLLGRVYFAGD